MMNYVHVKSTAQTHNRKVHVYLCKHWDPAVAAKLEQFAGRRPEATALPTWCGSPGCSCGCLQHESASGKQTPPHPGLDLRGVCV
eukprot:447211-Amphidinium_carterae.1